MLVCFPYAGGGTIAFRSWGAGLEGAFDVLAAKPPGREDRLGEPAFADARALAEAAADELPAFLDGRPFFFYGHSLGATVAFEVARALRRRGVRQPEALVLSGRCAPSQPSPVPPIGDLPDAAFIAQLGALAGTPTEVLENTEMMELLLPMLRSDFRAAERHVYAAEAPLDVSFVVHGGLRDDKVPQAHLEAWCLETTRSCAVRMFPGGHFFVDTSRAAVWDALREDLRVRT